MHFFIPNRNNPSLHIWTKAGNEEYDASKSVDYSSAIWSAYNKGEATIHEPVNGVSEPQGQVNETQTRLFGAAFMLALVVWHSLLLALVAVVRSRICRSATKATVSHIIPKKESDTVFEIVK